MHAHPEVKPLTDQSDRRADTFLVSAHDGTSLSIRDHNEKRPLDHRMIGKSSKNIFLIKPTYISQGFVMSKYINIVENVIYDFVL